MSDKYNAECDMISSFELLNQCKRIVHIQLGVIRYHRLFSPMKFSGVPSGRARRVVVLDTRAAKVGLGAGVRAHVAADKGTFLHLLGTVRALVSASVIGDG